MIKKVLCFGLLAPIIQIQAMENTEFLGYDRPAFQIDYRQIMLEYQAELQRLNDMVINGTQQERNQALAQLARYRQPVINRQALDNAIAADSAENLPEDRN